MTDILPISPATFKTKRWKKVPNYLFAVKDSFCILSMQEIPRAVVDMPIAFIKSDDHYSLIAILGLHEGRNLYVDASGRWQGRYVPALLRAYPFVLAKNESVADQLVLCINEASGLITDDEKHTAFFDEDGELSAELQKLVPFLEAMYSNRIATDKLCALLEKYDLISPWNIEVEFEGGPHRINGLFGINEEALNGLPDDDFLVLREQGALPIAYCQLLSMQHIKNLIARVETNAKSGANLLSDELGFDSFAEEGNISFDSL